MTQSVSVQVDPASVRFSEAELEELSSTLGSEVVEKLRRRQESGRFASPGSSPGPAAAKPQVVSKDQVIDIE
jgi:hypothetical protein